MGPEKVPDMAPQSLRVEDASGPLPGVQCTSSQDLDAGHGACFYSFSAVSAILHILAINCNVFLYQIYVKIC